MIELDNIQYKINTTKYLFNFKINSGEIVAFVGPSGIGKTTLLNLIAGFLPIKVGKLYLNKQDCTTKQPWQRPITTLFQQDNLFAHLTVQKNIALGITTKKLTVLQQQELLTVAERLSIQDILTKYPPEISGGQAQRVAIARSILSKKPILLLDEPLAGLDEDNRQEVSKLIYEQSKIHSLTTCIVTHHLTEWADYTDKVFNIKNSIL